MNEYALKDRLVRCGMLRTEAKDRERSAMVLLYARIQDAAAAGVSESEIARLAGVDRMTVRRALGKRP